MDAKLTNLEKSFEQLKEQNLTLQKVNKELVKSRRQFKNLYEQLEELNSIVERLEKNTSSKIGDAFFQSIVASLSDSLHADYVFIGKQNESNQCQTQYLYGNGQLLPNIVYDLKNTPCQKVTIGEVCVYPNQIQQLFPDDQLLHERGIHAYAGVPISIGQEKGNVQILVALFKMEIKSVEFYKHVLNIIASKIHTEIERGQLAKDLRKKNEEYQTLNDELRRSNSSFVQLNTELEESENRYRELFESANDSIIIFDVDSQLAIQVNNKTHELLGYKKNELIGSSMLSFRPNLPGSKKAILKHLKLLFKNGNDRFQDTLVCNNGRHIQVEISSKYIEINNDRFIQSIIRDITESVTSAHQIKDINEKLLNMLKITKRAEKIGKMSFFEYDIESKSSLLSDNFLTLFGYRTGEISTDNPSTLFELIHPSDAPLAIKKFNQALNGYGYHVTVRIKNRAASYVHVEVSGDIILDREHKPVKLLILIQDINEKIEREYKFKQVFESILDVYFETDDSGKITIISPSVKTIFGYKPKELIGKKLKVLYKDLSEDLLRNLVYEQGFVNGYRIEMIGKNGNETFMEVNAKTKLNENGDRIGILGIARNVTDRVEKERNLELYIRRLEEAERAGKMGVWDFDLVNDTVWWSAERFRMLGEEPYSFVPSNDIFAKYVYPDDFEKITQAAIQATKGDGTFKETFRLVDKQGNTKVCLSQGRVVHDENGVATRCYGVDIDITEMYQKQIQLEEKQRLENVMLNTIAEGVAIYNKDFLPIIYNKKAFEILNMSSEQFQNRTLYDPNWQFCDHNEEKLNVEDFPVVRTLKHGISVKDFVMGINLGLREIVWINVTSNTIKMTNAEGELEDHAVVSFANITDTIKKQKGEEIIAASYEAMREGIMIQDKDARIIESNDSVCEILGISQAQLQGEDSFDPKWRAIKEDGTDYPSEEHPSIMTLKTGKSFENAIMGVHKPNGEKCWIYINTSPIYHNRLLGTKPDGVVSTFTDVTQNLKNTKRERLTSAISERLILGDKVNENFNYILKLLSHYTNALHAEYWNINKDHSVTCKAVYYISRKYKHLKTISNNITLSFSSDPLLYFFNNQKTEILTDFDDINVKEFAEEYQKLGLKRIMGIPVGILDDLKGVIMLYEPADVKIYKEDTSLFKNISTLIYQYIERIEAHEKLLESLKEKDFLFKEVHHRVNNNLQLIISTLYLRIYNIDDDHFKNKIEDIINSVKSIAIIHEQLMQSKKVNRIEISAYIHQLANEIPISLGADIDILNVQVKFARRVVSMDFAVNFGLLINELMANSIKHAFKNNQRGTISITLLRMKNKKYKLIYEDDGIGISDEFLNLKTSSSLGLNLINAFSSQLKADVKIENVSGTKYTLTFKMN